MRRLSIIAWVSAVLLLTACGGSDTLTGSTTPPTTGAAVATLTVTSSTQQISSDGTVSATISAVAKDANNNLVKGAIVAFNASAGGLAVTQGTTDANGLATATLTAGGAAVSTTIKVTASSGGKSGNVTVTVVDIKQTIGVITSLAQIPSDGSKAATITALVRDANNKFLSGVTVNFQATSGGLAITQAVTDVNGAATATLDAAGDPTNRTITVTASTGTATATVPIDVTGTTITLTGPANLVQPGSATYTVALLNSSNAGISGAAVTLSSAKKNTLSASTVTTDGTGHATFTLTAVNAGNDTITAVGLGIQAQLSVAVSNQSFAFTTPAANAHINLGVVQPVTVKWTAGGVAVANQPVTFSATRGNLSASSATTNASGQASVTISSATSGGAVITATGAGVSTQVAVDFIATNATQIAVQASPSTVGTTGQSTITAVVRDPANNLVEGQTVNFQLTDVTGGTLSVGSALTNSQGIAQTVYTASTTTSSADGVVIAATVQGTSVTASTKLTVAGKAVFLSLGTGNQINIVNDTQYSVDYAVQAIDAAGNAVDGLTLTLTTFSVSYVKGFRVQDSPFTHWYTQVDAVCPTEDINGTGIYEASEDVNNNGRLDPGAVAAVSPGTITTANGGTAIVTVIYPKDHAEYVTIRLTAAATVQGTQDSTSTTFLLPGAAADFTNQNNPPPGPVSPYGIAALCSNPN